MERPIILLTLLMYITGIHGMECNGMAGLCDLRIDQVTFPGSHNAGSDEDVAGSCLWRNQGSNIVQQFISGIRYFDIDTCWHDGKVKNCHCGDTCHHGSDISTILAGLDYWMKFSFPGFGQVLGNEVVILHFNRDADISGESAKENIGKSLATILTELWDPNGGGQLTMNNYYKNNNNQWPTLRQAIETNQRIFVFMENGPAKYISPQPDWLVQSNGVMRSSWKSVYVGFIYGCIDIVQPARDKCDTGRDFMELAAFGTHGLCRWDMAWWCSKDDGIGDAMEECYTKRQKHGKTVNFMIVDFAVDNYETSVIDRAKTMNQRNIQTFG